MKTKIKVEVALIWFALAVVSGCGITGPAHKTNHIKAAAVVDMGMWSFSPETITVHSGETVEWRNTSIIAHTVTDDPKLAKNSNDSILPPGAPSFNSGNIAAGQVYTYRFLAPGTYRYFCMYHEKHGMTGMVKVIP